MPDECEEIQSGGVFKKYVERSTCLQNVSLADWTAWYDLCGKQPRTRKSTKVDIEQLSQETGVDEENNEDQPCDKYFTTENKIKKRAMCQGY